MNPPKKRCNIGYWEEGRSQFSVNAPYGYKKQMSDSGKKKSGKFAHLIRKDLSMFWMSHFVQCARKTNKLAHLVGKASRGPDVQVDRLSQLGKVHK